MRALLRTSSLLTWLARQALLGDWHGTSNEGPGGEGTMRGTERTPGLFVSVHTVGNYRPTYMILVCACTYVWKGRDETRSQRPRRRSRHVMSSTDRPD
ncbi:hypothetical protein LX32DRAFT_633398 [Colletotrichum zoysiae]|uniref:Secreted protein n=1 Tax=Colletotrichum zoysiae TaxID=1216348 RepID=A0AAD9HV42_9PEZI|nr:hypothetical protein LX32DRAFT_633398 [Colletotrichum zoysiae]